MLSRTFRRVPQIAGLGDDAEETAFAPVRYRAEGQPPIDDFVLTPGVWEALGKPAAIKVTVEAVREVPC